MKALKFPLFLLPLIGCYYRSPDTEILRAFRGYLSGGNGSQTTYVAFEDSVTAAVFRTLVQSGRVQIAPKGSHLYCPEDPTEGMHGYLVGARVDAVIGKKADQAVATLSRTCRMVVANTLGCPSCADSTENLTFLSEYLLVKTYLQWEVKEALSGTLQRPKE